MDGEGEPAGGASMRCNPCPWGTARLSVPARPFRTRCRRSPIGAPSSGSCSTRPSASPERQGSSPDAAADAETENTEVREDAKRSVHLHRLSPVETGVSDPHIARGQCRSPGGRSRRVRCRTGRWTGIAPETRPSLRTSRGLGGRVDQLQPRTNSRVWDTRAGTGRSAVLGPLLESQKRLVTAADRSRHRRCRISPAVATSRRCTPLDGYQPVAVSTPRG